MAKQTINQGTAPTGAGGDTFRTGSAKLQANDNELYAHLGAGDGTLTIEKTRTALGVNIITTGASDISRLQDNASGRYSLYVNSLGYGGVWDDLDKKDVPFRVVNGGTGAATAAAARTNLGLDRFQQLSSETVMRSPDEDLIITLQNNNVLLFRSSTNTAYSIRTGINTTIDPNGFIKNASPIVNLFADKIKLNDEAKEQNIVFEKLGVGDYLIKGSTGFAQDGWYIETPKDANGNLLVAVVYEQLENGDISVKTYDYMLNKKGRIVADIETPLDIPESRRIDLRLQELPQPEIEVTDDTEQ